MNSRIRPTPTFYNDSLLSKGEEFFSLSILATYENKTRFFPAVHVGHMMIQKNVNSSWYPDEAGVGHLECTGSHCY